MDQRINGGFKHRYRYSSDWLEPDNLDWILDMENKSHEANYVFMDWLRVRQVLEHEDYLLIERAKLLLAVQTILSAMIYFFIKDGSLSIYFPSAICVFGILMSAHLSVGMYKAKIHQNKVIDWWFSRVGFESKRERKRFLHPLVWLLDKLRIRDRSEDHPRQDLPALMKRQPPVAGKDPGIDRIHWSIPYWGIGGMFCLLWVLALVAFWTDIPIIKVTPD